MESNKVFKLDDITLKERLFEGLISLYGVDIPTTPALIIATLCDEYLDRSGYLLGEVRKESFKLRMI